VITSKEAAEVAHKHGLSLTDASALSRLADSVDEADELAGLFADKDDPKDLAAKVPRI
jgi:ribose 5-phosphate isomerase